jgi:cytidylate kinase
MSGHPIRLVTVTREFGAGGSEFASELGARLGWPVLDHAIVHRIAERLRVDDQTVEHFDEHPPSLLARIASFLVIPQPETYDFTAAADLPSHDRIAAASTLVLREAAAALPLIIVGHGSQCLFAGRADALHVFLHGPLEARTRRIVERLHVEPAAAPAQVARADRDRQAYVQRYFHTDWRTAALYDLQFNTEHVTIDDAVAMVEQLVRKHAPGTEVPSRGPTPGGAQNE